jgi:hypothetical protein
MARFELHRYLLCFSDQDRKTAGNPDPSGFPTGFARPVDPGRPILRGQNG